MTHPPSWQLIIAGIGRRNFIRIAPARSVRRIPRGELAWGEVRVGRSDALFQFFDLKSNNLFHLFSPPFALMDSRIRNLRAALFAYRHSAPTKVILRS